MNYRKFQSGVTEEKNQEREAFWKAKVKQKNQLHSNIDNEKNGKTFIIGLFFNFFSQIFFISGTPISHSISFVKWIHLIRIL